MSGTVSEHHLDLETSYSERKKTKFINGKNSGTFLAVSRGHNHTTGSAFYTNETQSEHFRKLTKVFNRIKISETFDPQTAASQITLEPAEMMAF